MYVVIFKAEINSVDKEYFEAAKRVRDLAVEKYGCVEFSNVTENGNEISVSYWESEEDISKWKDDIEHQEAQRIGKEKWYRSYSVEVAQIARRYRS